MNRMVRILAAGRAAVADAANAGTAAVTITRMELGSGLAPADADDDARAALRRRRDASPVRGAGGAAGDIAVRADIDPTAAYAVTEVGLFARIGGGAEFLFAYWAAAAAGDALAAAVPGGATITVAAVVRVAASAADVAVSVAPDLTLSVDLAAVEETDTKRINFPSGGLWLVSVEAWRNKDRGAELRVETGTVGVEREFVLVEGVGSNARLSENKSASMLVRVTRAGFLHVGWSWSRQAHAYTWPVSAARAVRVAS